MHDRIAQGPGPLSVGRVLPPNDPRASMLFFARWVAEDPRDYAAKLDHLQREKELDHEDLRYKYECHIEWVRRVVAWDWMLAGMQSVQMPHRYAAALMATDIDEGLSDLRLPWGGMEIVVPSGIVATPRCGQATAIHLSHSGRESSTGFVASFERVRVSSVFSSIQALARQTMGVDSDGDISSDDERAVNMLRRLAVNVVLDIITHAPGAAERRGGAGPRALKRDHQGRAVPTAFVVGRPLAIDCRQDIRDFITGTRRSEPKVTTLVRGHWRHQAHGPQHALRRLQWIQPFYRGHGPLLVRPTRLGFRHDAEVST
jgi:hypothetical protein